MSNDSKDELTLRIGEKLTAARIESGYTQSRAARAVGTSQSCISAVEHGKKLAKLSKPAEWYLYQVSCLLTQLPE